MNKQQTDRLILQYREKIFGFALEKMRNISQAEELAADIVCEVYASFLNAEEIANPDGYVYRVASNVYAKYIHRLATGRSFADVGEMTVPQEDRVQEDLENAEELIRLRQEIGFLSERQRTVIYLHYYEKSSVSEIAARLNISAGTVKWHLSDARCTLKEELMMETTNNSLTVNPIRFASMGIDGYAGEKGSTADIFDTRLKQNIAFACYHTPMSAEEIARTLNIPAAYIEDELKTLVEYGYLDPTDRGKNPKYRTNMYIIDSRRLNKEAKDDLYREAAEKYCDSVYPKLFEAFDAAEDSWGFFCDGNDKNFMKYSLVMAYNPYHLGDFGSETRNNFKVSRPDGGCFIAHANVTDDCQAKPKEDPYWCCGYMFRNDGTIGKISLDCRFSERSEDTWLDDLDSDWASLYEFIRAGCDPKKIAVEKYKRLCDKAYIHNDRVQVVSHYSDERYKTEDLKRLLRDKAPALPGEIRAYAKSFDDRLYELLKELYPAHIRPICRMYCTNALAEGDFVPYLIEKMLERGMLKPLTELQKKSVFSVFLYQK